MYPIAGGGRDDAALQRPVRDGDTAFKIQGINGELEVYQGPQIRDDGHQKL